MIQCIHTHHVLVFPNILHLQEALEWVWETLVKRMVYSEWQPFKRVQRPSSLQFGGEHVQIRIWK